MGITGLWDILGEGEVCSIADYAARHFTAHHRPLRIAVDAACWRFTNLTAAQVSEIRSGEPSANPIEKVILWRVLRLLRLNINLLFVDDGPRRPWKRNKRGGSKVDHELTRLTHKLLDNLKVPHHQAPGEAEAECARLQAEGIVDAVWSDDGDVLMFGGETLIRQHKVNGKVIPGFVRIYRASELRERLDLDAESLVLFALLSGGDYDTKGLPGCGPVAAAKLSKRERGLAHAVCHASQYDLRAWREELNACLGGFGQCERASELFTDFRSLCHYRNPVVSSSETLRDLRGLRRGWEQPIDQTKLRVILRERFNIWTRGFLKHVAPVLLVRALARAATEQGKAENLAFCIDLKRTRAKKKNGDEDGEVAAKSEVKISFSPLSVLEIDLSEQPPDEDWSLFKEKDGSQYDPLRSIDTEVLHCLIEHGLPSGMMKFLVEASTAKASLRNGSKKASQQASSLVAGTHSTPSVTGPQPATLTPAKSSKKRGRPARDSNGEGPLSKKTAKKPVGASSERTEAEPDLSPSPPIRKFRLPSTQFNYPFKYTPSTPILEIDKTDDDDDDSGSEVEVISTSITPNAFTRPSIVGKSRRLFDRAPPPFEKTLEVIDLT